MSGKFTINIKVKVNCKEDRIEKISEIEYRVNVKERAENNKANLKIIKLLSKFFKERVYIKKGLKSKSKVIAALK